MVPLQVLHLRLLPRLLQFLLMHLQLLLLLQQHQLLLLLLLLHL